MIDWDPNDPEAVKVHYDVSAWNIDQRAELASALADEEIAHVWDGDELIVPEELEARTDELFSRLENELGPFAVRLGADDESVEYGLDEWPDSDRDVLTAALVEAQIPHRWEGTTAFVAADAERTVDELLDAIEAGTLVAGPSAAPPDDALSRLFASADRLAKDADDNLGREDVVVLAAALDPGHPPYGVAKTTWKGIVDATVNLADLSDSAEPVASDVIGAAQELRSLVRPYV